MKEEPMVHRVVADTLIYEPSAMLAGCSNPLTTPAVPQVSKRWNLLVGKPTFPLSTKLYSARYAVPGCQCVFMSSSNSFEISDPATVVPEMSLTVK
jgi:hypothetical protein